MKLEETNILSEEQIKKLKERWINTVEEVVNLYEIEDMREPLKNLLGVSDEELEDMIKKLKSLLPEEVIKVMKQKRDDLQKRGLPPLGYIVPDEEKEKWGMDDKKGGN